MRNDISPSDLSRMISAGAKLKVIDVRSPGEFALAHIPGAVNLPLEGLGERVPLDEGERLVVVCQAGGRSSAACQRLEGYHPEAMNLLGGTSAWRDAGFRVEGNPKAPWSPERQVHLVAGLLLAASLGLGSLVSPGWFYLAALPAAGFLLDGLTGACLIRVVLRRMPWNRAFA